MQQNGSTSTTVNALIGAATNAPVADPAGPSATGPPETSILQSDDDASIATGISETSDDDASIATDISETSNTAVLGEEQVCKKNQNGGEYIVGTAPFCNAGPHSCTVTPNVQFVEWVGTGCWTGWKVKCRKLVTRCEEAPCKYQLGKVKGRWNFIKFHQDANARYIYYTRGTTYMSKNYADWTKRRRWMNALESGWQGVDFYLDDGKGYEVVPGNPIGVMWSRRLLRGPGHSKLKKSIPLPPRGEPGYITSENPVYQFETIAFNKCGNAVTLTQHDDLTWTPRPHMAPKCLPVELMPPEVDGIPERGTDTCPAKGYMRDWMR